MRPRPVRITTPARILTLDIETAPHETLSWGLFGQNISLSQLRRAGGMICWVAKYYGEPEVHFASVYHDGVEGMLSRLHELLSETDVLVTYNGKSFDEKHIRRAFVEAGLAPLPPFHSLDLIQTVRRSFRFASNKLDHVSDTLLGSRKVSHSGQSLWNACLYGEGREQERAWETMRRYNIQDVRLTERLLGVLVPYLGPTQAVLGRYASDPFCCPRCGNDQLSRDGVDRSLARPAQLWRCRRCRGYSRSQGAGLRAVA